MLIPKKEKLPPARSDLITNWLSNNEASAPPPVDENELAGRIKYCISDISDTELDQALLYCKKHGIYTADDIRSNIDKIRGAGE